MATPLVRFRNGNWWQRPLPNPLPAGTVHSSNSTYLSELANGAGTFNSFHLVGGVGNNGAFATPVAFANVTTDPSFTIIGNNSAMVTAGLIGPTEVAANVPEIIGQSFRIPATIQGAFTTNASNTGTDREFLVINTSTNIVFNLSNAYFWTPGQNIPGVGTSPGGGAWSAKGGQLAYLTSYGHDANGTTFAGWPDALRSYADEPLNGGNHRGNNPAFRTIRWDQWVNNAVVDNVVEMYAALAGSDAGHFPMTGSESKPGAILPEGLRVHVKFSVNLATKLNWLIASAGQAAYDQAMMIAVGLRDYGFYVGDNSGGPNSIKLEANEKETNKSGRLWTIPEDAFKNFSMTTDFECVRFDYDPPSTTSPPPPPPTPPATPVLVSVVIT